MVSVSCEGWDKSLRDVVLSEQKTRVRRDLLEKGGETRHRQ
jgi:hypothetical protein